MKRFSVWVESTQRRKDGKTQRIEGNKHEQLPTGTSGSHSTLQHRTADKAKRIRNLSRNYCCFGFTGSRTLNRVSPRRDSNSISPPCRSATIRLLRTSPRPVPAPTDFV